MAKLRPYSFDAPAVYASALVNGDETGLDYYGPELVAEWEAWCKDNPEDRANVTGTEGETWTGRHNGVQTEMQTYTALESVPTIAEPFRENVSCKWGAPMGRGRSDGEPRQLYLRRVPLNNGGYDPGGAYWGHGEPLWCAWSDPVEGDAFEEYHRAPNRQAAKVKIRAAHPKATFRR